MNRPHLSDDELIELMYGLGDTEGHLAGCSECAERLSAMGRARTASVDEPPISGRVLAAQRHQILEHLERTSSAWSVWRWVPAAAAAALLAVAVYRYQPSKAPVSAPAVVINAESDAELFTDVYSMERDVEPRAAAPIRSLFQETAFEKEGQ